MISKFVQKPIVVEAMLYDGKNLSDLLYFVGDNLIVTKCKISIRNDSGEQAVQKGDFIVKSCGNFYPCKPDIFKISYNPI